MPAYEPNLPARQVHARFTRTLEEAESVRKNLVLWFADLYRRKLYLELGYTSVYAYTAERHGFSRSRCTQFIRLAESLSRLPALRSALAAGEMPWTKAREVVKVATPATERAWVAEARRSSRRALEEKVIAARGRARQARSAGRSQGSLELAAGATTGSPDPRDVPMAPGSSPTSSAAAGVGGTTTATEAKVRSSGDAALQSTARPATTGSPDAPDDAGLAALAREIPEEVRLRFPALRYAEYGALVEKLRKLGWRAPVEDLVVAGLAALAAEGRVPGRKVAAPDAASDSAADPASVPAAGSASGLAPNSGSNSAAGSASDSARGAALGSVSGSSGDSALGSAPGSAPNSARNSAPCASSDSAQASTGDTGRDEAAGETLADGTVRRAEVRTRVFTGEHPEDAIAPEGARARQMRTRVFTGERPGEGPGPANLPTRVFTGEAPGGAPGSVAGRTTTDANLKDASGVQDKKAAAVPGQMSMRTRVFTAGRPGEAPGPANLRTRVFTDTPYHVVVRQCGTCGKGEVVTGRGPRPIPPAELQAVLCDARVQRPGERNRAAIPPARRREVLERDDHRCRVPGCGSAHFLSVHHVEPRAAGGSNASGNLVTLCASCHRAIHEMADRAARGLLGRLARRPAPG